MRRFILMEPIEEDDKVKAELCKILTAEHIKEYIKAGIWPGTIMFRMDVAQEFEENFSGPSHLSANINRPSTSSENDS
uniref:Uncharacterized protein n=1 Tax=Glossina palpalis gambiensis TaxID=67801 RepID=A0A1B0C6B1_9MUSC